MKIAPITIDRATKEARQMFEQIAAFLCKDSDFANVYGLGDTAYGISAAADTHGGIVVMALGLRGFNIGRGYITSSGALSHSPDLIEWDYVFKHLPVLGIKGIKCDNPLLANVDGLIRKPKKVEQVEKEEKQPPRYKVENSLYQTVYLPLDIDADKFGAAITALLNKQAYYSVKVSKV